MDWLVFGLFVWGALGAAAACLLWPAFAVMANGTVVVRPGVGAKVFFGVMPCLVAAPVFFVTGILYRRAGCPETIWQLS